MTIPTTTPLPTPPSRLTDDETTFASRGDAYLGALPTFQAELNTFAVDLIEAASAANYSSTSATSVTIGTGAKSFTVDEGKLYIGGQTVLIASAASVTTHYMYGVVTSYDIETGALVVDVQALLGTGATRTDWLIGLTGPIGPAGGGALTNPVITGTITEDVYTITDGASVDINPENGSVQLWTLGANRTPTATMAAGQSVTLMIADGTAYAVTWTSISPAWVGGSAPTLPTSGYAVIELWKVGSTIYAAYVGNV